ncbi:alpha/beta hydrolase [Pleurocapsales cyanobacterium LEGE 06147]|nr:alpha/beta hydrolase [Pleurocapsales cyanobacterium LEGE 06147]
MFIVEFSLEKKAKTNLSSRRSPFWQLFTLALLHLGLGLSIPPLLATRTLAAEKIYLDYGPLQFSLAVESLELYAREGTINRDLADYTRFLTPKQLEDLRTALVTSAEITPLAVAQFLYSPQGERILEQVGQIIQTKAGQPGFYAIRSALILAAAEPEGLTPLNILKNFPTYGIRINSQRGFEIIEKLSNIVQQTEMAIAAVKQEASRQMKAETLVNISPLPNFSQPGKFAFEKITLTLEDRQRRRTFSADLYLPQQQSSSLKRFPLVIISHGLGSDRITFAYLARHLASYGFAVAVPEHPGSSASQLQALFNGLASEVTPAKELIDRPLDIQYLLDRLEASYGEKIDVLQAGIIGQSFGGYTALALAGAKFNFNLLTQACPNFDNSLNVSLLLQCLALELPNKKINLQDRRIVAAIAINPLTSGLFGREGLSQIQIPIMFVSGSADPVTPALSEQIEPFTWLKTPHKYLALLIGGTHFSTLAKSNDVVPLPPQAIGPDPAIAQNYIQQLSLVFFNSYVANLPEYRGYLSADYAATISQDLMPLSFVRSLLLPQSN